MKKMFLLVLFAFSGLSWASDSQKCSLDSSNLEFIPAVSNEIQTLVEFAIISNDSYGTRTEKREIAEKIFEVSPQQFESKLVEKLFAKDCKQILGFYTLKDSEELKKAEKIELGHLFVKPGYFRKGLGSKIFHRANQKAKELHRKTLFWISDPDAEKFYLRLGAKKVGTDDNLLNPSVPVPLFEYSL